MEPALLTLIITNVFLLGSHFIQWMRKIKKSSCCGGTVEMQRDDSEESEQNKKRKSKK